MNNAKQMLCKAINIVFVATLPFIGCINQSNDSDNEPVSEFIEPLPSVTFSRDEAYALVLTLNVEPTKLVYADLLPFTINSTTVEMAWGFVEQELDGGLLVTFIDRTRGIVLGVKQKASDSIRNFVHRKLPKSPSLDGNEGILGSYHTFPWGWRLPFSNSSNGWKTCGYGCYLHTGTNLYSTDWDPGDEGLPVEAPAGCWALNNDWKSGYGWQFMAECGDAGDGSGRRYYYRVAHLKNQSPLVPGWWIDQGTPIGQMGNTGTSTASHIHFTVFRGTEKDGVIAGGSLPISQWPGASDSICNGKLSRYNFSRGTYINIKRIEMDGCPP